VIGRATSKGALRGPASCRDHWEGARSRPASSRTRACDQQPASHRGRTVPNAGTDETTPRSRDPPELTIRRGSRTAFERCGVRIQTQKSPPSPARRLTLATTGEGGQCAGAGGCSEERATRPLRSLKHSPTRPATGQAKLARSRARVFAVQAGVSGIERGGRVHAPDRDRRTMGETDEHRPAPPAAELT